MKRDKEEWSGDHSSPVQMVQQYTEECNKIKKNGHWTWSSPVQMVQCTDECSEIIKFDSQSIITFGVRDFLLTGAHKSGFKLHFLTVRYRF